MAIRDWRWPQWIILMSVVLLLILGSLLVYALLTPTAFAPTPPEEVPGVPITGLPTLIEGRPALPPSAVEGIPSLEIQGRDIGREVDLIARGDITRLSSIADFEVDHFTIGPDGDNMNYYDPQTSRFYRISDEGVITKISDQVFAEVSNTTWAANSKDAVLEFPDGSNVVYDFETGDQTTLPAHWEEFDFSPDSNSLAFKSLALDPAERWLAVSSKNGGSARRIAHLGDNEKIVDVDWSPNNQVVATYSKPDGLTRSEVFFVGFNDENFPLTKVHGLKFEGAWTPTGKKMLYSSISSETNFNPNLWIVDGVGPTMGLNRQPISLQTWTDKCTFASDEKVYCGVPVNLPRGAGLIPSIADDISDVIYEVDLLTGNVTPIAIPEQDINVKQMTLSGDGKSLYINDRFSGGIKKIDLE